jgi:hypothetical protein
MRTVNTILRDATVLMKWRSGVPLTAMAHQLGITPTRVGQIAHRALRREDQMKGVDAVTDSTPLDVWGETESCRRYEYIFSYGE